MTDAKDYELFLTQVNSLGTSQRGGLLTGHVISIGDSGVIVDLGLKRDGVIPRSDLERLPDDEAQLEIGDEIAVMVVDPVDQDGNLIVSIAQARESGDWLKAKVLLENDDIFEATSISFNRGGLIVPFGRLRGFVPASHLSELPRGLDQAERAEYLEQIVGKKLPFKVLEVDPQRHRLVLSERKAVRQWRQERKSEIIKSLNEGEVRKGVVTSLREFGAFVDIGGADGLIHISELSWKRVDNPGQLLEVGQEVDTLILHLDYAANRIGLSLKRLQTNPWKKAAEKIEAGMVLDGKVTRQASSGVYVGIEDGIEGLVRSTLGYTLPPEGMHVRVRVLSFDREKERMNLEMVADEELVTLPATIEEHEDLSDIFLKDNV
jgi:small subunit ribosomal protein S1